jgi:hypothetical protein
LQKIKLDLREKTANQGALRLTGVPGSFIPPPDKNQRRGSFG